MMTINTRPSRWVMVLVALGLGLFVLACGGSAATTTTETTARESASDAVQESVPMAEQDDDAAEEVAVAPTAEPAPEAAEPGTSRRVPLPLDTPLRFNTWAVTILDVVRGEEANQAIAAANQFNDPAPEGYSYVLVTLRLENISEEAEAQSANFGVDLRVTGDRNILYSRTAAVVPQELGGQLFPGGAVEGQEAFLVPVDETNLLLQVDETLSFDSNSRRFLALDPEASLAVGSDVATLGATEAGNSRSNPAQPGETVITNDWEVTLLEAVRGEAATQLIQEANSFNDPAPEGEEYVAVRIRARYIGTDTPDNAQNIGGTFLRITGAGNVIYEWPGVVAPAPTLDANLFPGGSTEGWVVLSVTEAEQDLVLVFEPLFSFSRDAVRYIAVE